MGIGLSLLSSARPAVTIADVARTLLIVDDDPRFRRVAREILTPRFAVVAEAGDRAEALAALEEHRPEAVLLDVNLPDASGLSVAGEIAAGPASPRVVLTSSEDLAGAGDAVAASGARGFLPKAALNAEALALLVG